MNLNICKTCGGELLPARENWQCKYCGNIFTEEKIQKESELLRSLLDEQKREQVSNLRRNLYDAIKAEYTDSGEICRISAEIKKLLPDDFMANFFDIANRGTIKQVAAAIRRVDTDENKELVDLVFHHILASLCAEYVLPLQNLVERAYKKTDLAKFEQYSTLLSDEAACVDSGMYEVTLPRDVFVMYSSHDMEMVEELVETLEENGISCFVAARNLRHGRGAVENYRKALEQAMDSCRSTVFVSTPFSRNMSCDAIKYEIPHIRKGDLQAAPAEYRHNYAAMPAKYKKPRVEYRLQQSNVQNAADTYIKEFFEGFEYAYSALEVADRVFRAVNNESLGAFEAPIVYTPTVPSSPSNAAALLKRATLFLEEGNFARADEMCEQVLNIEAENGTAYFIKLLAELKVKNAAELKRCKVVLEDLSNFKNAMRFGDAQLKKELADCLEATKVLYDKETYQKAVAAMKAAKTAAQFQNAAAMFRKIPHYEDAQKLAEDCDESAEETKRLERAAMEAKQAAKKSRRTFLIIAGVVAVIFAAILGIKANQQKNQYNYALTLMEDGNYDAAYWEFEVLGDYKDSKDYLHQCGLITNRITCAEYLNYFDTTELVIPEGVTSLGYDSFESCKGIVTSIHYPSTYSYIGRNELLGCNKLEAITVSEDHPDYYSESNCVIEYSSKTLTAGCKGSALPEGVLRITQSAFNDCLGLTSIVIPSSVMEIDCNPFAGCSDLTSITVQSGNSYFYSENNCLIRDEGDNNKELVAGCTTSIIPDNVTDIDINAFNGARFSSIHIPQSVYYISSGAFSNCVNLTEVAIPYGVGFLEGAFQGCTGLESIYIDTTGMPEEYYPTYYSQNNCIIKAEDKALVLGCKNSIIPNDVKIIGYSAFEGCAGLTQIAIPESVVEIQHQAFGHCSGLTSISIPKSVTNVVGWIFFESANLTDIYCQASAQPAGWDKDWTIGCNATIHWGSQNQ